MSGQLIEEFHIADARLIRTGTYFLKGRESHKKLI
jgi:hypothetical protein